MNDTYRETGENAGFSWEIVQHPRMRHLSGYIDLPAGHPWHGQDYDAIHSGCPDLEVHGGLTYSRQNGALWRVGFDCAHAGDFVPGLAGFISQDGLMDTYKDASYVRSECESLCEQAAKAGGAS